MTPNAQRIAIAEACGWTEIRHNPRTEVWDGVPPKEQEHQWDVLVPDYLTDLNAMHEAEKMLVTGPARREFLRQLYILHSPQGDLEISWNACHATAAQRAEAFLRTLNLWKDS